ncbi:ribonuclease P protein component [Caenimonas koreensis]|uniref:Ribonuclease P protein component n=1 Tax=Caenimonas koreensis DSM 17982 TaxID=1121255 RepID=A0A844B5F4_9BURK|nr:ribonuclease P protein component [Caenimonas koreensis]MRD46889.1 ribonuclease P protein component [Caenimonas koreensis DSM 17982]
MQRLKSRAQFQAVLAGTTVSRTAHFALHRAQLDAVELNAPSTITGPESNGRQALFLVRDEAWLGAMIPKRWAKRAVTRNTIKRQIYAVSSLAEPSLQVAAHVVRLRAGFDRKQFPSASSEALKRVVRGELEQLFAKAPT